MKHFTTSYDTVLWILVFELAKAEFYTIMHDIIIALKTAEPNYNISLCCTSCIALDILWCQLIPHC